MVFIRQSKDRGYTQLSWLNSWHTFSFAEYYNPQFMHFGHLRVINEDIIQSGGGFQRHPHNNMEIISYVVEGILEHKDSMGNGSLIKPGEIQVMSAGTGIEHSEFNYSKTQPLHLLQIWILPNKRDLKPRYQQKAIPKAYNEFILIGAEKPAESAVVINQEVNLYTAFMTANHTIQFSLKNKRKAWLQLIKGEIKVNHHTLFAGDGAAVDDLEINIECLQDTELLLFDVVAS